MQCEKCGKEVEKPENCPHCVQQGYPGHHGHVHHHPPTSGLAVASMILGILSTFFWLLTAIPGLIIGIFGLTKINMGCRRGKGMAISGIVLSGISIFCPVFLALGIFIVGMTTPALSKAREKARRVTCSSTLKSIGLTLKQYAMDNNDYFPDKNGYAGLKQLVDNGYLSDPQFFQCPSCDVYKDSAYVYLGGSMEASSDANAPHNIILAFDMPGNHDGYINVLFQDGHVEGVKTGAKTATEFVTELSKMYKYTPGQLKLMLEKAAKADKEQLKLK